MAFNTFASATTSIPLANLDANFTMIGTSAAASTLFPTATTSITYGAAGTAHYWQGGNVVIDSSGNVGIGTSSPVSRLHVSQTTLAGSAVSINLQNTQVGSGIFSMNVTGTGYSFGGVGGSESLLLASDSGALSLGTYASNPIKFIVNQAERMRIDSSGNVGIGTSSPTGRLHIANAGDTYLRMQNTTSSTVLLAGADVYGGYLLTTSAVPLLFYTNNTDRMRIDSSGNLLVGYTTSNGSYKLQVNSQIFATSSTIATSDQKYKENISPLENALDLVCALNPVSFDWKNHSVHNFDRSSTTTGFIAQEVQTALAGTSYVNAIVKSNQCTLEPAEYETIVIEAAVEEEKDENGNVIVEAKPAVTEQQLVKEAVTEEFLGIAEGNLIALLTAAVKELKAELDTVKTQLAALQ